MTFWKRPTNRIAAASIAFIGLPLIVGVGLLLMFRTPNVASVGNATNDAKARLQSEKAPRQERPVTSGKTAKSSEPTSPLDESLPDPDRSDDDTPAVREPPPEIKKPAEIKKPTEVAKATEERKATKPLTDFEGVAAYIRKNKKLPDNFVTKATATKAGWKPGTDLDKLLPGKSMGGDTFGNREGLLPKKLGRIWFEADINFTGGKRGADRIVFSNDGLIYKTTDHYKSFTAMKEIKK